MVTTKHCTYGECKSDTRYPDRPGMENVTFFHFPNKKREPEKCLRWVMACKRRKNFGIDKISTHSYICSKHFKGQIGPTPEYPDPISATASESQVMKQQC